MIELSDDCDLPELLVYLDYLQEFSRYPDEVIEAVRALCNEKKCWPDRVFSYRYWEIHIPTGSVWVHSQERWTRCKRDAEEVPLCDAEGLTCELAYGLWDHLRYFLEAASEGHYPELFKTYPSVGAAWLAVLEAEQSLREVRRRALELATVTVATATVS
jgi:hypothetical protein